MQVNVHPKELKQLAPDTFGVSWSDGVETQCEVRQLRLACPCASCVNEWTREKMLRDEDVPKDVKPERIEPVGRYALRVHWSDGHNTGIYTFEALRKFMKTT